MGKNAYLYAFEGMADWEYGYLVPELNTGRYFAGNKWHLLMKWTYQKRRKSL